MSPIIRMTSGDGPMKVMPHASNLSEVRAFCQETVSGMNGVGVCDFRRAYHGRDVQVAFAAGSGTDADGFVSEADVEQC